MFIKNITYTDYNGENQTEDFYFFLSRSDLLKLNSQYSGGIEAYFRKVVNDRDAKELSEFFDTLIRTSYGEKTPDGKHFTKLDPNGNNLFYNFIDTPAYDELYVELLSDTNKATEFILNIMPSDLSKAAREELEKRNLTLVDNNA